MEFKVKDERDQAPDPLAAYLDAERRSRNNQGRFSTKLKARAGKLFELAKLAYPSCRLYQNYREKFIAVKVESAHRPDHQALDELNKFCDVNNVYGVKLGSNLVYRIYKN